MQVVHPLEVIIGQDDGVQLSVVVIPLLLWRMRGLSRHLLVVLTVCQILLHLQEIDEAPISEVSRSRKAGQYVVVMIPHSCALCMG